VMQRIINAMQEPDEVAEALERERLAVLEEDLNANDEAVRFVGTELSGAFRARQMLIAEDYSLARSIQRARAANQGNEIPEELRAKLEELTAKLQEAIKKSEVYEARIAELEATRSIRRAVNQEAKVMREKKRTYVKSELDVEFKSLSSQLRQMMAPTQLNMMIDPSAAVIMVKMAKNRIQAGITTVEGIVNDIYDEVADVFGEDLSKRDVRDAISGYGKTSEMSAEEIDVKLRELKRQARLISAYEDATAKLLPLRSGLQRDKISNEVRELGRKVRQAMKESGVTNITSPPEEQ